MLDHVSIPVSNLAASAAFYDKVLTPLGLARLTEREKTIGFGKKYPEFWLNHRPNMQETPLDTGFHFCLRAPDKEAVIAFHMAARENGGQCAGEPGDRQAAMTVYFGAFILDPDGNKIEAITFPKVDPK
jgi:catechol 2,3-dioxygenase-like lactoylglutathione lyase family enzyme